MIFSIRYANATQYADYTLYSAKILKYAPLSRGYKVEICRLLNYTSSIVFITVIIQAEMFPMTEVSGFCLKCKTYGPIKDGKMIVMSNGRTRCAGFCSQPGCTGKISKIVS